MTPPEAEVPQSLRVAAAYSWRILVTAAAVAAVAYVVGQLWIVSLAIFLALFATAMLRPPAEWLRARGWPNAAAAAATAGGALALVGTLLFLIVPPFVSQLGELGSNLRAGIDEVGTWLTEGPLELSERQLEAYVQRVTDEIGANSDALISGLLTGAQVAGEVLVMLALALVITFFFLKDGDKIARWLVGLLPSDRRSDGRELGRRSWDALAAYLRGMTIVALFDSILIGIALALFGVPAALPLAVITFFGAFIPVAGAVVTGLAAALVALVAVGPGTAVAILVIVIVVQQTESNLLQPLVVGRAVAVHPVAILLAVVTGGIIAGIPGAFVAVPVTTVLTRAGEYLGEVRSTRAPGAPG